MKKLTLFIPLVLLFTACFGQQKFNKPEVKEEKITFVCEKLDNPASETIIVYNKNNFLEKTQKAQFGELLKPLPLSDKSKFTEAFWDAFREEKLKTLLPERNLPIMFCVDKKGRILEVAYILKKIL